MAESRATPKPAREGVRLLVCGLGEAAAAVERLRAADWSPERVEAVCAALPAEPVEALEAAAGRLRETRACGVLLAACLPRARGFRVELRAQNRTGKGRIAQTGPSSARTTAPAADLLRAIAGAALPVSAASDAVDDLSNYVLYRLLTEVTLDVGAPTVGLLHLPDQAAADAPVAAEVERGLRLACNAFAATLSPLPRAAYAG